jgi:hypothetical protein
MRSNTTGSYNVAFGRQAGYDITTGTYNTIIGYDSDVSASGSINQIVIGYNAVGTTDNTVLLGNGSITNWLPTDTNEVDLGSSTKEMKDIYVDGVAYTDAIGFGNVAMTLPTADGSANEILKTNGSGTLSWTTNVSGASSLDALSDAKLEGTGFTGSMILGHQTTGTLDAAEYNVAVGITALDAITSGDANVAIGYDALTAGTAAAKNVAFGAYSLAASNGYNNVAIGYKSGSSVGSNVDIAGGSNNVIIGHQAGVDDAEAGNRIVIGKDATGTTDNTVLLGNSSVTAWLPGNADTVDLGTAASQFDVVYANKLGFASTAMTLPTADGSADQVLKTNGSGALGWATVSGGGGSGPQVVGWRQSNLADATEVTNSVRTVGNLKFRWNSNDYLEIIKVSNTYQYSLTEKEFHSNSLNTFKHQNASGATQYNSSDWKAIYLEWDGSSWATVPTSLGVYQERQYEIMEVDTSSNASSVFNKYTVISYNDGWGRFHYEVTYKSFGATQ